MSTREIQYLKTRKKKKKPIRDENDFEELDFRYFADEIYVADVHPDVIEQMENRLRKIKREEEN